MNNMYDLVIMLPGNTYTANVEKSLIPNVDKIISDALKTPDALLKLDDGERSLQLRPSTILGWYFKKHTQTPQERMLDIVEKSIEPPEDDWKRDDN